MLVTPQKNLEEILLLLVGGRKRRKCKQTADAVQRRGKAALARDALWRHGCVCVCDFLHGGCTLTSISVTFSTARGSRCCLFFLSSFRTNTNIRSDSVGWYGRSSHSQGHFSGGQTARRECKFGNTNAEISTKATDGCRTTGGG